MLKYFPAENSQSVLDVLCNNANTLMRSRSDGLTTQTQDYVHDSLPRTPMRVCLYPVAVIAAQQEGATRTVCMTFPGRIKEQEDEYEASRPTLLSADSPFPPRTIKGSVIILLLRHSSLTLPSGLELIPNIPSLSHTHIPACIKAAAPPEVYLWSMKQWA